MKEYEINAIDMVDKSGCTSLPVDVRRISDYYNYRIRTYSTSQKLITAMCLNDYINTHNAVSFYHEDSFYILISDNLDLDTERRVIAHEIGHIALRHHRGYDTVRCQCAQYEQEANAFALYLLAPPSLLVGQRIESAAALKDLTHLCMADSRLAYQNLVAYQKVYDILQRPAVLRRRKRDGFRWGVALIGLLLVIATAVALHFFGSPMLRTQAKPVGEPSAMARTVQETVYWTSNGQVYHLYGDCQALRNCADIQSGIPKDSQKSRVCCFCKQRSEEG